MPNNKRGEILMTVLVFSSIAITATIGLVNWGGSLLKSMRYVQQREQALQIAEAGIEYYRWHLAHEPSDFTDGNPVGTPGPFVHDFKDKNDVVIGNYALTITPPPIGSTVVKIKSKGILNSVPPISRTVQATLAIPSLARFAIVSQENMYVATGTQVYGPVHSNGGIRFDGVAHNVVTSAQERYNDPSSGQQFGVYTTVSPADPTPPADVPDRPDVFVAGRVFPVPAIDFTQLTANLSQLKSLAQAGGVYLSTSQYAGKTSQGYHLVLKTNDTYDLYVVTSQTKAVGNCSNTEGQGNWGTWSIQAQQFIGNYAFPANGIIFIEDNVWIDGQINGARLTVAVGKFPASPGQWANIIVNENLTYTNYDGTDVLGLIAQGSFNMGMNSAVDLRIDGALVAQNGRIGMDHYSNKCQIAQKNSLTLFGMMATYSQFGLSYTDGVGYATRELLYDNNLIFNPPPGFPLVSTQYETVLWEEIPSN